jgi:hypothetical protein
MDMVNVIITVMLVCAAACAIALVWPAREPRQPDAQDREPIDPDRR